MQVVITLVARRTKYVVFGTEDGVIGTASYFAIPYQYEREQLMRQNQNLAISNDGAHVEMQLVFAAPADGSTPDRQASR